MSDITPATNLYVEHNHVFGPGRLAVFKAFLDGEFSDQEIAAKLNMKHKTVSARRVELWRNGFIKPVTMRKQKRQRARVWGLTETGQIALNAL